MEGPFLSPPAKRPYHNLSMIMQDSITATTATTAANNNINISNPYSINGASKRRSKPPPPPLIIPSGHVALRFLCHVSNIGGVIGKSGSAVKLVRQETGAKVRIEEAVDACDERVVLVVAPENPKKKIVLKGSSTNEEEKESGDEQEVSSAQEALVKLYERVLDVDAENEGIFPPPGGVVSCRLLAATSQVGAIMGKGGKVIERIRKETGSRIRVLPADQLPACASPSDEVIQIMGDVMAVKKAIVSITHILQDNPPADRLQAGGGKPSVTTAHGTIPDLHGDIPQRNSLLQSLVGSSVDYASRSHPLTAEVDKTPTTDTRILQQEVVFRFLCSNDCVGAVIGKGGAIVRALQNETGASISVASTVAESDERVITISALEASDTMHSPAQMALIRVFTRSIEGVKEKGLESGSKKSASVSARVLVPSNQVGCLLGKGGSIISDMRKSTGTSIRIIVGDQVPKCASESEEVVQITGEPMNVQDALYHVTGRLRENIFPSYRILNPAVAGSHSSSKVPNIFPLRRVGDPTSPVFLRSMGPSHNLDRQATLTQSMDHLGLSHNLDRPPSPKLWAPSQILGGGNSRSLPDIGRGLTSLRGGVEFGSGGKSAIVTNTTVEIVVPEDVIGSVYGENGSNISRLRQISGAKVIMHDPRPGTRDAMVIISGTPDQTQAAQSLLQAFILSGQSSPDHRARLL